MRRSWQAVVVGALALVTLVAAWPACGAEYVIGAEDVLQVSVWMHPELERSVTVGANGNITFPPDRGPQGGRPDAEPAGHAARGPAVELPAPDRDGDRDGHPVHEPERVRLGRGRHARAATASSGCRACSTSSTGPGARPRAPTSPACRSSGARGTCGGPWSWTWRGPCARARAPACPALRPGDTIVVPGAANAAGEGGGPAVASGDAVGVLGEVTRPGLYPVGSGQDLWMALASAGGLTPRGRLGDVRVVRPKDAGSSVFRVDLKDQLHPGRARDLHGPPRRRGRGHGRQRLGQQPGPCCRRSSRSRATW